MPRQDKHWLGSPHTVKALCPVDFREYALREIQGIAIQSFVSDKFGLAATAGADGITINQISYRQLMELTLRAVTLRDLRLKLGSRRMNRAIDVVKLLEESVLSRHLPENAVVSVDVQARRSPFFHEGRHKEVVEGVLAKSGWTLAPKAQASYRLKIFIHGDLVTLWTNQGGRPLYYRGYKRVLRAKASMREDLAQNICRHFLTFLGANVDARQLPIFVPFAGSGTLGFEMAIALHGLAPSLWRDDYAGITAPIAPSDTIAFLRRKIADQALSVLGQRLIFIEDDAVQCDALRTNIAAFLEPLRRESWSLDVRQEDVLQTQSAEIWQDEPRLILLNPPYGERLGDRETAERQYEQLATRVSKAPSAGGFIICPDMAIAKPWIDRVRESHRVQLLQFVHGGTTRWLVVFASKRIGGDRS